MKVSIVIAGVLLTVVGCGTGDRPPTTGATRPPTVAAAPGAAHDCPNGEAPASVVVQGKGLQSFCPSMANIGWSPVSEAEVAAHASVDKHSPNWLYGAPRTAANKEIILGGGGYPGASAPATACNQWAPSGQLATVPVIPDCTRTGGDIAVTVSGPQGAGIFYCPQVAAASNAAVPGSGHFFFVHEYGHVANMSSDERLVDCWAAQQLAQVGGGCYLEAAYELFMSRPNMCHPRYGCGYERAARIKRCALAGGPPYP